MASTKMLHYFSLYMWAYHYIEGKVFFLGAMLLTQETSGWTLSLQTHLVCVSKNQQEESPIPDRTGISSKLPCLIDLHQYVGFLPSFCIQVCVCVCVNIYLCINSCLYFHRHTYMCECSCTCVLVHEKAQGWHWKPSCIALPPYFLRQGLKTKLMAW